MNQRGVECVTTLPPMGEGLGGAEGRGNLTMGRAGIGKAALFLPLLLSLSVCKAKVTALSYEKGNELKPYYTNSVVLLAKNMLCSQRYCRKGLN